MKIYKCTRKSKDIADVYLVKMSIKFDGSGPSTNKKKKTEETKTQVFLHFFYCPGEFPSQEFTKRLIL
jgi:hypothetical protein